MSEPEAVLVPPDSPYQSIDDLVDAWKADPTSVAIGGGSSPGGPTSLDIVVVAVGIFAIGEAL